MSDQVHDAVVLDSVGKGFRTGSARVEVLRDVSLRVGKGEFIAVMGASGSGKTTLLNVMAGLLAPDSGRVVVDGTDYAGMSDARLTAFRREHIGFVFQMYNLVDSLDVEQNVMLPRLASGRVFSQPDRTGFDRLMREVGLQDRLRHKPSELSGGEQQRAAIARALINDPALVLADEPTGNLDSESTQGIGRIFRDLHERMDAAFVLVTHDAEVAMWAERLVVIRDGMIVGGSPTSAFGSSGELAAYYQRAIG